MEVKRRERGESSNLHADVTLESMRQQIIFPFMHADFLRLSHRETFFPWDRRPVERNHHDIILLTPEQVPGKFHRRIHSVIVSYHVCHLWHLSVLPASSENQSDHVTQTPQWKLVVHRSESTLDGHFSSHCFLMNLDIARLLHLLGLLHLTFRLLLLRSEYFFTKSIDDLIYSRQ